MAQNNTNALKESPAEKAKRLLQKVTMDLERAVDRAGSDEKFYGSVNVGFVINGGKVEYAQVTTEQRHK